MVHEEKKVAKIVEELTLYFFAVGANEIQSKILREDNMAVISMQANYHPDYREQLYSLDENLNSPRNDGIEDIYWELVGSGEPGEQSQLLLIGMMIDKAEIDLQEESVKLKLYKELLE